MKSYRRILGFSLVPNAVIIDGLRANVSKLQLKVNSQQQYIGKLTAKMVRLKEQQEINRTYTEDLKACAANTVSHPSPENLRALDEALRGVRK